MRSKSLAFLALCGVVLLIFCGCHADKQDTAISETEVSATEALSETTILYTSTASKLTEEETESCANADSEPKKTETEEASCFVSEESVSFSFTPEGGIVLPDDEW